MKIDSIVASLGALSEKWLKISFRFRRQALTRLVRKSGFAPRAAETMLDALFRELTAPKLRALLRVEVGSARRLDGALRGPRAITHVLSGNVPNPGVQSLVHGLLVKSFNYVKPSSRDEGILDFYLASLRAHDRRLAASCELLEPSDRAGLRRAIASSDLVVAYGSDESVAAVRAMAGRRAFIGYGHRVSFSLYTRGGMGKELARKTTLDVWMMDRRGCLSPALIFVEESPALGKFYTEVLREMALLEKKEGVARQDAARSTAIRWAGQAAQLEKCAFFDVTPKGRYFVKAARIEKPAWIDAPGVDIRTYRRIGEVYGFLSKISDSLQAVALECPPKDRPLIAQKLFAIGATRVCRAGTLQFPPATWKHDGRPNFSGWLTGADLE